MAIDFACKCGKALRAQDEYAGRKVQCPACGRVVGIPAPAEVDKPAFEWQIESTPDMAERAEQAGVVRHDRAKVVRLHSPARMTGPLWIEGAVNCWHCRTIKPVEGAVFGRVGIGGTFVQATCPECSARTWTGFSTHETGRGTDIYLYAPTHARQYTRAGDDSLPLPAFRIDRVVPGDGEPPDDHGVDTLASALVLAVSRKESYQQVSDRAAEVVTLAMTAAQMKGFCRTVRSLLEKESTPHLRALLVEVLATLRDDGSAPLVQTALRRTLEREDPSDATNLPLHDLCVMALLFGDKQGLKMAMARGMRGLDVATRAYKLDRRLSSKELSALIDGDDQIDSYGSTLGGNHWQRLQPLLPLWEEDDQGEDRKSWFDRFFGRPNKT